MLQDKMFSLDDKLKRKEEKKAKEKDVELKAKENKKRFRPKH